MNNEIKIGQQFRLRMSNTFNISNYIDMVAEGIYTVTNVIHNLVYWYDDMHDSREIDINDFHDDFEIVNVRFIPVDTRELKRGDRVVCLTREDRGFVNPFTDTHVGGIYDILDVCSAFVEWDDDTGHKCSEEHENLIGRFARLGGYAHITPPSSWTEPMQLGNTDTVSEIISPPVVEDVGFGTETIQYLLSRHNIHVEDHHARAIVKMVVAMGEVFKK